MSTFKGGPRQGWEAPNAHLPNITLNIAEGRSAADGKSATDKKAGAKSPVTLHVPAGVKPEAARGGPAPKVTLHVPDGYRPAPPGSPPPGATFHVPGGYTWGASPATTSPTAAPSRGGAKPRTPAYARGGRNRHASPGILPKGSPPTLSIDANQNSVATLGRQFAGGVQRRAPRVPRRTDA